MVLGLVGRIYNKLAYKCPQGAQDVDTFPEAFLVLGLSYCLAAPLYANPLRDTSSHHALLNRITAYSTHYWQISQLSSKSLLHEPLEKSLYADMVLKKCVAEKARLACSRLHPCQL